MATPEEFYDDLAGSYDAMTRFRKRAESVRPVVDSLLRRFPMRNCLDAACGTGLHAILLAAEGVRATGSDISQAMLAQARKNAADAGQDVDFVQAGFAKMADRLKGPFDAVLCLGNSIPHVLTTDELTAGLRSFRTLLNPDGVCILEILNYERILNARDRIVGAHRSDGIEFVRFYDFIDPHLRFNILRLNWKEDRAETSLNSTTLHPYTLDELESSLNAARLRVRSAHGSLKFTEYAPSNSDNLVIVADPC